MSDIDDEPELYLDAEGLPILFDVVVAGDVLRGAGFRLSQPAPAAPAPDASALERAAAGPVSDLSVEEHADLEQRIREAVEAALPRAAQQAVSNLRRSVGRDSDSRQPRDDD